MDNIILRFSDFTKLNEAKKNNIVLYHGGNISKNDLELKPQKASRMEHGAGLYLTTHLDTAYKYSKGSRKLYRVELEKGKDISEISIPFTEIDIFIKITFSKANIKIINDSLEKFREKYEKMPLFILNNILINNSLLTSKTSVTFSTFLKEQGVDYIHDNNTFGWGEDIYIVINFNKIKSITQIKYSEEVNKL